MKAEYDLTAGKRGAVIPNNGKTRITIWIDDDIIEAFRTRAEAEGIGYQTLVNQTLRLSMTTGQPLDELLLRRIIREEIQSTSMQVAA
ncbi:BrnA antitoxin family protein [Candidatus Thiothrix anitrata]|uniref:BrnA antitoxin family protein n=1 Tax=Candidatus Thiothrix anitrata TaxID=2823902 RepID=A0ABX7X0P0_9GAMM|nr:BrnA antitoxin family protein [Candidatus Thiothrix anitrata]QTR49511.1 BrnA antitoxin family protein [Candidatus Thiothrix anitrata]